MACWLLKAAEDKRQQHWAACFSSVGGVFKGFFYAVWLYRHVVTSVNMTLHLFLSLSRCWWVPASSSLCSTTWRDTGGLCWRAGRSPTSLLSKRNQTHPTLGLNLPERAAFNDPTTLASQWSYGHRTTDKHTHAFLQGGREITVYILCLFLKKNAFS